MNLAYIEQGQGMPVVLIHGFCESSAIWKDFIPSLAQHYRVIALDLGGFGNSANLLPANVSMESLAEQIYTSLQYLNVSNATFVAHSLGGYVCLALAEAHPEMFEGLCLFHSTAFADSEERRNTRNKVVEFVQNVGVEKYIESFVGPLFYEGRKDELQLIIKRAEAIGLETPLETVVEVTKAMRDRRDRTHVLKDAQYPIMFIIGKQDSSIPFDSYSDQINLPKKPIVHVLDETGHMGMFERPEKTLHLVEEFCEDIVLTKPLLTHK